jgi:antitoxin MazE
LPIGEDAADGRVAAEPSLVRDRCERWHRPRVVGFWYAASKRLTLNCTFIRPSVMRSRIVQIGNSHVVRLPKRMIAQAGLGEDVDLRVEGDHIIIATPRRARAGWAEAARRAHKAGDDRLESNGSTRFDLTQWK